MNIRIARLGLVIPLLAGSLLAASGACNRSSSEAKVDQSVTVTKADKDRTVKVATGGRVTLRLPWSPGTGYDWQITQIDASLLQQDGEATSEPNPDPKPGAPETRIFVFKALKAGDSTVELKLLRSFEKSAPPLEVFKFQVSISN